LLRAGPQADVLIQPAPEGKRTVVVKPKVPSFYLSRPLVDTSYPDDLILLILETKGASYVCDEIARDEDPTYVAASLQMELFAFLPARQFAGQRVLDFGCGAGASTMILSRLLEGADIYGVELDEKLLRIARARARHYGFPQERLVLSPNGQTLPATLGTFDVVVLSAVWEHLLPAERPVVMRQIWSILRPGGRVFINQTPHRFTPVETHTTGLPLINYLPDWLALSAARRFSRRVRPDESWASLLRRGIRGGSQHEVMRLIVRSGGGSPTLLMPSGVDGVGDLLDLWYKTSVDARLPRLKWCMWAFMKGVKILTGAQIVPELTLAIQKNA
jgi:2-polyprenyl-3-methyl-5-hydroxy-6-metoxy-1,4-benzoquinol methylase